MSLPIRRIAVTAAVLSSLFVTLSCPARELAEWEAGAGVTALSLPDYRGSDQTSHYVLPIPYFVYRGKYLKADEGELRGLLFDSDTIHLNFSVNGSIPVNSRDNVARKGMEDLRPAVEIGPVLETTVWRTSDRRTKIDVRFPIRAAFTLESDPRSIGWIFFPSLSLSMWDPAGLQGWRFGATGGVLVNNRRYNNYFYSVPAADATATRPAYDAPGGYAGSQFILSLTKRFPKWWVGGFLRADSLQGANFEDSPLVKRSNNLSAGIAVSWVLAESSRRVDVDK